jgi:hypothetical protein
MGLDTHMIAGSRACSTSIPAQSPDHHQPDKPALCRGPGPGGVSPFLLGAVGADMGKAGRSAIRDRYGSRAAACQHRGPFQSWCNTLVRDYRPLAPVGLRRSRVDLDAGTVHVAENIPSCRFWRSRSSPPVRAASLSHHRHHQGPSRNGRITGASGEGPQGEIGRIVHERRCRPDLSRHPLARTQSQSRRGLLVRRVWRIAARYPSVSATTSHTAHARWEKGEAEVPRPIRSPCDEEVAGGIHQPEARAPIAPPLEGDAMNACPPGREIIPVPIATGWLRPLPRRRPPAHDAAASPGRGHPAAARSAG